MKSVLNYVRKNYLVWLVALVVSVLYGAFAASESYAQAQAGNLKTTETSFSRLKDGRIIFKDESGDYFVGDNWKTADVVGTLEYYGETVYLIVGGYGEGNVQCREKWVVLLTAKKKAYSRMWVLPTCHIETIQDFDVTVSKITVLADDKAYSFEP